MSHRLVSNSSVVWNAQTLQSSYLTIVMRQVNFLDNEANGPFGGSGQNVHQVQINGVLFANYSAETQTRLEGINYTLTEEQWDAFYNTQTFTTTSPYDKVLECALFYIKDNLQTMFGLTKNDWTFVE